MSAITTTFPKEKMELPDGWGTADWLRRVVAEQTPLAQRTDDQWELLDRPTVWTDPLAAGFEEEPQAVVEEYPLGAGEIIEP